MWLSILPCPRPILRAEKDKDTGKKKQDPGRMKRRLCDTGKGPGTCTPAVEKPKVCAYGFWILKGNRQARVGAPMERGGVGGSVQGGTVG